ncbi:MAG: transporter [Firmicutes bacterium]|nr:transporter [Bacillota bacterium]
MINKTHKPILPLILTIAFILTGCAHQATPDNIGKTAITDASGAAIMIPAKIERIADAWPAHNEVLCLLGAGNKIVATTTAAQVPWLYKINPQFNKATAVFGGNDTNIEELMKAKPDIVFMTGNGKNASQLTKMGIPTIQVGFNDFTSLKECVKLTGTILGSESSQRADQYIAYLDEKINLITAATADIPLAQRPRVIHVSSVKPLLVDGKNTIINAWIELAGGTNAAETTANTPEVSLEQIVKWNPDIIIIGNTTGSKKLCKFNGPLKSFTLTNLLIST